MPQLAALPIVITIVVTLFVASLGATFYFARDMGRTECRAEVVSASLDFVERRQRTLARKSERDRTRAMGSADRAEERTDRYEEALDIIAEYGVQLEGCSVPAPVRAALCRISRRDECRSGSGASSR